MDLSPKLWTFALAVAAVTLGGHYATGFPSERQTHNVILGIMRDDEAYRAVLSEKVKLNEANVPPSVKGLLPALDDVDPLDALRTLVEPGDHYSGDKLALGALVVGTAVKCTAYKRVALHLLLTAKMLELDEEMTQYTVRALVFADIIPRSIDVVSSHERRYADLMRVYDVVADIASQKNERELKAKYVESLNEELRTLNAEIAGSCMKSAMNEYYEDMKLKMPDGSDPPVITADQTVAGDLQYPDVMHLLKASENAILDLYEDLPLLRNVGLGVWQSVLKHGDLPTNKDDFERVRRPSHYDEQMTSLDRFWEDRIRANAQSQGTADASAPVPEEAAEESAPAATE